MTASAAYIEYKLARWLSDFDKSLFDSYAHRIQGLNSLLGGINGFRWIEGKNRPFAFRFEMETPAYLVLSKEISRFMSDKRYRIFREEQTFATKFGQVPVYLATLNLFSVLKVWGERAKRIFSDLARPLPEEDYAIWELSSTVAPAEYSSMNFVEIARAEEQLASEDLADIMRKFFVFGFWELPKEGFACSTTILHDDSSVRTVLNGVKGPYVLGPIHNEHFHKGHVDLDVQVIKLWGLQRNASYSLTPLSAWLTKDLAEAIAALNSAERLSIINGVVQEFRRRSEEIRPTVLTVIGGYGTTSLELAKCLIGVVASERFHDYPSLSIVGHLDEVESDAAYICRLFKTRMSSSSRLLDEAAKSFERGIQELYPVVVSDGTKLMFVHPYVVSTLSKFGLIDKILKDRRALVSLLRLLDYQVDGEKILKSAESQYLRSKGIPAELLVPVVGMCAKGVCLAKALRGCDVDVPDWLTSVAPVVVAKCPACGQYDMRDQKGLRLCPKCGAFISKRNVYS